MSDTRRALYPPIDPHAVHRLPVSSLHELHVEESGNPRGLPVIGIHGGPGAGSNPLMRRFFDPSLYRIILFDQRGCGRSTPHAELRENTTHDLVEDMEKIRVFLGIDAWVLFGGSWGSTLALAYAQAHRERVRAMVLRGVFLLRQCELDWFYGGGAARIWPEPWQELLEPIPPDEHHDLINAYYRRLTGPGDRAGRVRFARAWSRWEGSTISLLPSLGRISAFGADRYALAFARIETHYFAHGGFLDVEGQLLRDIGLCADIPGIIVQGRYDVVTPPITAWTLHKAWPASRLVMVPDAGHAVSEPGIASALVRATDALGAGL